MCLTMSSEQISPASPRHKFVSTAGMVMVAMSLSRLLGLARESLLGSAFSASAEMDAFRAASRIPDTLYVLVAGGALGSAFIPTFTAYLAQNKRQTAWQVASAVINLFFLIAFAASVAAFLLAP
ncbi:MAG: hypothetical protein JXA89_25680, partial [Anaerolineae bacterium]|nr:hypothetical protein [Anaerolineae bacterium]